ncbi:MAG: iron chelate uptake ABC transporter family permease subunit, partial [Gammaproteobacteria bacterium]
MRPVILFTALLLATLASFLFSLSSGTVDISWRELLAAPGTDMPGLAERVVIELRWPRTAAAFTTGALLA